MPGSNHEIEQGFGTGLRAQLQRRQETDKQACRQSGERSRAQHGQIRCHLVEPRQDPGNPGGDHGLPRSGRARQEQMMRAGGGSTPSRICAASSSPAFT